MFAALGKLLVANKDIHHAIYSVDADGITVLYKSDWPSNLRFRSYVTDHEPVRASRKASVREQSALLLLQPQVSR